MIPAQPTVYVIAGPNGAGKTTFASEFAGQRNLFRLYRPLVNAWWLYDASRLPPLLIANEEDGNCSVIQSKKFEDIQRKIKELSNDRSTQN